MGVRWQLAACGAVLAAVSLRCGAGSFQCQTDQQCSGGMCEDTGWCSFPDGECDSGSRYGALAGGGLAGACVDPAGTSGGTGEPSAPSTSGDTAPSVPPLTSEPGSSSGDPSIPGVTGVDPTSDSESGEFCGNGSVEDNEACDDGNDQDGDGCDADCTPSGETVWTGEYGDKGSWDSFRDVVVDGLGQTFVAGDYDEDPFYAVFDAEGGLDRTVFIGDVGSANAWGIDIVGSSVAVGGRLTGMSDGGFVAIFRDEEGDVLETQTVERIYDVSFGGTPADPDLWASGSRDGEPVVASYSLQGMIVDELAGDPLPPSGIAWDLVARGNMLYVAGEVSDTGESFVHAVGTDGEGRWESMLVDGEPSAAYGLAHGGGGIVVATGFLQQDNGVGIVAAFNTVDGAPLWSASLEAASGSFANIHKAAIGPSGEVVAVGWVYESDSDADIWVAKYTVEGELVWERQFPGTGEGDSNGWGVAIDEVGGITIVGSIYNADYDGWIARLEP